MIRAERPGELGTLPQDAQGELDGVLTADPDGQASIALGLLEHDEGMRADVADPRVEDVAVGGGWHGGLLRVAGPAPCRDPVVLQRIPVSWPRGAAPWLDLLVGFRVAVQEVSVPDGSTPVGEVVVVA